MGWWRINIDDEPSAVWGDEPADVFDTLKAEADQHSPGGWPLGRAVAALADVRACFVREWGRPPTPEEIRWGLRFSDLELPDDPE